MKSIALKHYGEAEVKEAWKEMAKLKEKLKELDPKLGLVTKRSRQKTDLDLDDIEEAINKLIEAKCLPLVLASNKMMLRAPRFWGKDKGEDISGVAAELKELKEAMVGFIKQNEKQMNELKEDVVNASSVVFKPRVAPKKTEVPTTPHTPGGSAKRTRFQFENEVEEVIIPEEEAFKEVTYAKKAAAKKEAAVETLAAILSKTKNDKSKKYDNSKTKVIYGSAKADSDAASLAADVSRVAFGVNKECSRDSMKTYLIEKGIDVIDVIDMTREEVLDNVNVKTMKVVVKASQYERAMDPSIWPCRVGVRLWKDKEAQKARYERWQERQEQGRSKTGGTKEQERPLLRGASTQKGAKPEGGKKGNTVNKEQNRSRSGNRYQGNIFEELLRQVLRA